MSYAVLYFFYIYARSQPEFNYPHVGKVLTLTVVTSSVTQVILAIAVSWVLCAIITAAGGFPSDPSIPQYKARTDARTAVLREAKWFRVPFPG